jgi:hypothetical protein
MYSKDRKFAGGNTATTTNTIKQSHIPYLMNILEKNSKFLH